VLSSSGGGAEEVMRIAAGVLTAAGAAGLADAAGAAGVGVGLATFSATFAGAFGAGVVVGLVATGALSASR